MSIAIILMFYAALAAASGDWPEPRQNAHLTGVQPVAGAMKSAPVELARFDLGRSRPPLVGVVPAPGRAQLGLVVVAGALQAYETSGKLRWQCHPPGLNFMQISAAEDLDGDGRAEVLLMAGRPQDPYGAAVLVDAAEGTLRWRYDVDPMSYQWYLHAGAFVPGAKGRQIAVIMQGYPPEPKNGYIALFDFPAPGAPPRQLWRYDFDQYTCFPSLLQTDLDGDGAKELVVETHSRMWVFDAPTGKVKQFYGWDVAPGNVRSYGLTRFVDLNGDGREDFLCIANFAQHHEVLLNKDGKFEEAWHKGWAENVTTGKIATVWPEPPYADLDGDKKLELAASMFNANGENAWQTIVYDAVSGAIKQTVACIAATRCADVDGDAVAELIGNAASDAARTQIEGARIYAWRGGALKPIWKDDALHALPLDQGPSNPAAPNAVWFARGGERLRLTLKADGTASTTPYTAPPPAPDPWAAVPPMYGPPMPTLLAADLDHDGRNDLIAYSEPKVSILSFADGKLTETKTYESSSLPVLTDLDGDGATEIVLSTVRSDAPPIVEAKTPSKKDAVLWRTEFPPPSRAGLAAPRKAYLRAGRFTGAKTLDIYVWAGAPMVRSAVLGGRDGHIAWDRAELPEIQRYWGPSMNLAAAHDTDGDGADEFVFTNPDYYCIASGKTGDLMLGPLAPPKIFNQASMGLYTMPAVLDTAEGEPNVCLVNGHYFQAGMTLHAQPAWYAVPATGDARTACEGFLRMNDGKWLMGFGRQNGSFACLNAADGKLRWEFPLQASATDVVAGDVDGDGAQEFVFGTSHGTLHALGDADGKLREVWRAEFGVALGNPILADLDGDGKTEIAVSSSDGHVRVLGAP